MPRSRSKKVVEREVVESLREYGRGVAGGLMFSLPLLYTMEVWWAGFIAHPLRLFAYVIATFVLLLGYNRYGGLRRDASMTEVVIDSVEELGIGLLLSAAILFLLGRIRPDMPATEIVGLIVVEAMTVAIGVSVGTAQLGGDSDDKGLEGDASGQEKSEGARRKGNGEEESSRQGKRARGDAEGEVHYGGQVLLSLCGAVLFAANVAPTEEVVIIAIEASWWRLLGLVAMSLLIGTFILFYVEFRGARQWVRTEGFSSVLRGTFTTYAVALVASALILWFFGRFDGVTLFTALAETVVLGVAATLGASAGRLLLQ
ncbi:MAG TPA: TIGR02587 family membrane protein [Pyrinomonadaceae bacterium]|jgi:putative integral membrane protein (TIGR02587 family)